MSANDNNKRKQRNWIESFSGDLNDLQKEIDLRKQSQQTASTLTKDTMTLPKVAQSSPTTNTNTIHVNTLVMSSTPTATNDRSASDEIDRMLQDINVTSPTTPTSTSFTTDTSDRPIAHLNRTRHSTKSYARRSTPFPTPTTIGTPSSALMAVAQAKQLEQQQGKVFSPPTSDTFAVPNVVTKKFLAPSARQIQQEEQQQSLKKKGSIFDSDSSSNPRKGAFATKTMGMAVTPEGRKKSGSSSAPKKAPITNSSRPVQAASTTTMASSGKKNKKRANKNNNNNHDDFMAPGGFLSSDITLFDNPNPDEWVCLFCQYDILMYGYEAAKKKNGYYKRKRQREKKLKEAEMRKNNKDKEKENSSSKDHLCDGEHNHLHHNHHENSTTQTSNGSNGSDDNNNQLQAPTGSVNAK
ncbi:hypothetical protein BDF20DRAFT_862438 [Mycotypha africana]|uniref:uncharacterized protein n=1 Tax=Mycotypha africana TaxID=64632 RepID=UPI0023008D67|nr:uncharacterized protein BDF20DRAFT_862438 [Mycotypha africana]KAI8981652.1 hypothetical protein BDF20DRAFT_862438 [Mycotypha africana]